MKRNSAPGLSKTILSLEVQHDGRDSYDGCRKFGGWDLGLTSYTPIHFISLMDERGSIDSPVNYALDCIAIGYESGRFASTESFLNDVFATTDDLLKFREELRDYCYWFNERHFYAFLDLLTGDESGMLTYEDLGDCIDMIMDE